MSEFGQYIFVDLIVLELYTVQYSCCQFRLDKLFSKKHQLVIKTNVITQQTY